MKRSLWMRLWILDIRASFLQAVLLHKVIVYDLTCVFVDHGLLRKNEGNMVEEMFRERFGLNIIRVNAGELFLKELARAVKPKRMRKMFRF